MWKLTYKAMGKINRTDFIVFVLAAGVRARGGGIRRASGYVHLPDGERRQDGPVRRRAQDGVSARDRTGLRRGPAACDAERRDGLGAAARAAAGGGRQQHVAGARPPLHAGERRHGGGAGDDALPRRHVA